MKKISAFILSLAIIGILNIATSQASGIVHLEKGDYLNLNTEDDKEISSYEWVLLKDENIIDKSTSNKAQYRFTENGKFRVNLTIIMRDGSQKNTYADVIVSDTGITKNTPLLATLESLPQRNEESKIFVTSESKEITFMPKSSQGKIAEYRIDANIDKDSSGDGITDNDIDNRGHDSYYNGTKWSKTFNKDELPVKVELTVVDENGNTESDRIEIVYNDTAPDSNLNQSGDVVAKLSTFPPAGSDGIIHLTGEKSEVTFYAGDSIGNIKEYRFDKNIIFDTDDNGNPADDIDNKDHPSYLTGEMFTTDFEKSWGDIVIQLTAVGEDGKGSQVKRKIIFDDEQVNIPINDNFPDGSTSDPILISNKNEIFINDSVDFTVLNPPENAEFAWDFDGDGILEETNNSSSIGYLFESEGQFETTVMINNDEEYKLTKIITVKKPVELEEVTNPPTADFTFSFEADNVVAFTNTSFADPNLLNTDLSYYWDFGDGETSTEQSPKHEYKKPGEFDVVLTSTDAADRKAKKVETIIIENVPGYTEPEIETPDIIIPQKPIETDEEGISFLFIILLILGGLSLITVIFFIVEKVRHPSLTFSEIFEGLRDDFSDKIQKLPKNEKIEAEKNAVKEATAEIIKEKTPENDNLNTPEETTVEAKEVEEPAPLDTQDGKTPAWLKTDSEETINQPAEEKTPDWLKEDSESSDNKNEESSFNKNTASNPEETQSYDNISTSKEHEETNIPDWLQDNKDEPKKQIQEDVLPENNTEETQEDQGQIQKNIQPNEEVENINNNQDTEEVVNDSEAEIKQSDEISKSAATEKAQKQNFDTSSDKNTEEIKINDEEGTTPDWLKEDAEAKEVDADEADKTKEIESDEQDNENLVYSDEEESEEDNTEDKIVNATEEDEPKELNADETKDYNENDEALENADEQAKENTDNIQEEGVSDFPQEDSEGVEAVKEEGNNKDSDEDLEELSEYKEEETGSDNKQEQSFEAPKENLNLSDKNAEAIKIDDEKISDAKKLTFSDEINQDNLSNDNEQLAGGISGEASDIFPEDQNSEKVDTDDKKNVSENSNTASSTDNESDNIQSGEVDLSSSDEQKRTQDSKGDDSL